MKPNTTFAHRLNGYSMENPETFQLPDVIGAITERAEAALLMVQSQFLTDDARLNDKLISDAMDGILMDLLDIRQVISEFSESKKKAPIK